MADIMQKPNEEGQFSDAEEENNISPNKNLESLSVQKLLIEDNNSQDNYDYRNDVSDYEDDSSYYESDNLDEYDHWNDHSVADGRDKMTLVNSGPNSRQNPNRQSNTMQTSSNVTKFQPSEKVFKKFSDKINVDRYEPGQKLSGSAVNKVIQQEKKDVRERYRVKDKADRATMEQVMDPRTRMILFKLLNRGFISEINGCISTGKEANVYHCTVKDEPDRAIKIYKTSILVFKDRDKYVTGEFRFRSGYGKKNPRKMVRTWAEKEMRNLTRLYNENIPCPKPVLLRSHVLLMEFIGQEGWPAPRLQDVEITESKARELYWDLCLNIRNIYQKCKLVHGDLSEFNLLYHDGKAYVIDVSQSVEHDHPHALEFLRKDLHNVTEFFRKKHNLNVLTVKELFDFVVDPQIDEKDQEEALEKLNGKASQRTEDERSAQEQIEAEVFKQIFIPRKLIEVNFEDIQKDIAKAKSDQVDGAPVYKSVTGVQLNKNDTTSDSSENDSSDSDAEDDKSKKSFQDSHRPRGESPNSRKERKKAIKDEQAEKRKSKIKKHVKKRKEKASSTKKK